jgi:hypothetical protein
MKTRKRFLVTKTPVKMLIKIIKATIVFDR